MFRDLFHTPAQFPLIAVSPNGSPEILPCGLTEWEDSMKQHLLWIAIAIPVLAGTPALAQPAGDSLPADAAGILNSLPPDLHKKLQQLSQLIDQNIKAGKLTETQVQQELVSGRLEQTIRSLGPEANQLFDDIKTDMKNGKGPGEDALIPLLGGLGGAGK
jgi:hypothetical protein